MRVKGLGILCLALLNGCLWAKPCETDRDCAAGGVCDPTYRVCFGPDDGGASGGGGGSIGGGVGGGTVTGGGAGGGSTGGGAGGGTTGGGAGGGATGGGTGGGGGTVDSGTACDGVRSPSCDGGFFLECRTDVDANGICEFAFSALRFDAPDASLIVGPNAQVDVQLTLTRKSGFTTAYPSTMQIDAGYAGQHLAQTSAGLYSGQLPAGAGNGVRLIGANFYSLSDSRTFTVDAVPPAVRLWVEDPPARAPHEIEPDGGVAWKKNERAKLVVQSSEHISVSPSDFLPAGSVAAVNGPCGCDAGYCACFEMNLASVTLNAARGLVPVTLSPVPDDHGNLSDSQDAGVLVTRFKWRTNVSTLASSLTPLVVGQNGTLFMGAREGLSGYMTAIDFSGNRLWSALDGGSAYVTAGPVLTTTGNKLFVALRDGSSSFFRQFDPSTGVSPPDICSFSGEFRGELAAASNSGNEYVFGVRDQSLISTRQCAFADVSALSGSPSLAVRAAGANGFEVFTAADSSAPLLRTTLTSNFGPVQETATNLFARNVFTVGSICGGGGGGGPTTGGLFMTDISSATSWPAETSNFAIASASPASPAVVGRSGTSIFALYGSTNKLVTKVTFQSAPLPDGGVVFGSPQSFDGGTSLSRSAPLIGEGDRAYVMGNDNVLQVLSLSTLAPLWTMPVGPADEVTPLTIDIARGAGVDACTQPGVLYVATRIGTIARIYAILVDSHGIDRNAPWPRAQHDPANTSSETTSLQPWSCP